MNTREVAGLLLALLLIAAIAPHVTAQVVHSVGFRVAFSWGDVPLMLGAIASMEFGSSLASVSLFLSPGGKTLLLASIDLPLEVDGELYLRATTGFFYYDRANLLPTPVLGSGLALETSVLDPVSLSLAGEFIYPIAFPMPLLSLSFGWLI